MWFLGLTEALAASVFFCHGPSLKGPRSGHHSAAAQRKEPGSQWRPRLPRAEAGPETGPETARERPAFFRRRRHRAWDALTEGDAGAVSHANRHLTVSSAPRCLPLAAESVGECCSRDLAADLTEWDITRSHSHPDSVGVRSGSLTFEVKRCRLTVWVFENLAQDLLNWYVSLNAPTWTYTYNPIALDGLKKGGAGGITQENKKFPCNNI